MTQGRRLPDNERTFNAGDYGKIDGVWYCRPPSGHIGTLAAHTVEEHEDGTITVTPSILYQYSDGTVLYHGWLTRGVWRSA